nr:hypothetical protein [Pantoea cypripedii]
MRERPILLNGDMVRAVLNGSKTQTRRIMKVQPESKQFGLSRVRASTKRSDIGKYYWSESNATGHHIRSKLFACPFGAVGDRLWVRETWSTHSCFDDYKSSTLSPMLSLHYWADGKLDTGKKRPSIHMPRWASRITLEITGVRVERLNSISGEDARSEGFAYEGSYVLGDIDEFYRAWTSIYGEESWQANPWVWVIEFRRVEVG